MTLMILNNFPTATLILPRFIYLTSKGFMESRYILCENHMVIHAKEISFPS